MNESLPLTGMERADLERVEALAIAQAEAMAETMRQLLENISRKAGSIERDSPLFYGSGDNPTLFGREHGHY